MPIYVVKCPKCESQQEIFRSLANFDDLPDCCGIKVERQICAPMVIADIQPYRSMATGEMITSRSQHRDHLKATGCVEVGNETMKPKSQSWLEQKTQKETLRKEIAARIDTI
jgi:hypothetical protein